MLMYGSVKGSRWFLLPWLVATLLFILAYMVGMVFSTVLFGLSVLSLAFLAIAIVEVRENIGYLRYMLYCISKSLKT